jgi:hypothetical protein
MSPETCESAPEISWTDIAGLRDLIAHEYFRIDIHRVLEIVERDLPPLEQAIHSMLSTNSSKGGRPGFEPATAWFRAPFPTSQFEPISLAGAD